MSKRNEARSAAAHSASETQRRESRTAAQSGEVKAVRPGSREYDKAVGKLLGDRISYDEFVALVSGKTSK